MKIAFNPSTVAALTSPPDNKDITFDLRGRNIFARGVKFYGTDTNTWRDIKINNVSIGSNILDLRDSSNTTLTNVNGVVTINSTWRPVVDNLTSNSATSSLSANQGRVLAGLINGKSDSDHNHDGRYIRKSGDTILGALNFANGTWNLIGDDSYMGDCNISGHFGIKAANTTYPGIAFFNNASAFLGNLTAYSGNIKYGAYSLQFLDNGNTSVSSSTWTNPFSAYNSNAVADGQAICVWGQASQLSNLSTDTGDMSLWLKRVNAKVATLNMVLDGEYYANGNQRLAHISEIPTSLKNPHSLILKANGTTLAIYDGSSAKEANFTYANVGAASASHTHSYYAVNENYEGFKKAERLPTSGFYQSEESESGGNAPWKSRMHLINCQHSNTNNNYALQIAASFYDNNTFKIRVTNNSVNNAWRDIIHSGNISSQSVASASKLQTARNIWGQSFDGTADVDNTLRIRHTTGNYCEGIRIQTSDGAQSTIILGATANSGTNTNAWSIHRKSDNNFAISRNSSDGANGLVMTPTGMGLGTTAPTQRLDVAGNIRTTGNLYISHATNNNMNHDTSNPRIVFSESGGQAVGLVYTDYDSYRPSKGLKVMDTDNDNTSNVWFEVQGYNYSSGYVKNGSNDNYVLLGGGGHKAESSLRVAYASNAGFTDWNNITNKPSMFNPAAHTHTWTSITDKLVARNEFNIVNAGFKEALWFNYLPINDRSKSATISAYCFGNGNKGYTAVRASGFIKNGGNKNQLLRADGGVASFNWSGQAGQPTWLWGGNDFNSYYVYNPSNFRVAYASSAGNAETLDGYHANGSNVAPYGHIPTIESDGVMEVGKYIDFHNDNSGEHDFSTRLQSTGNYGNVVNLPSASGTLALISDNVASATNAYHLRINSANTWSTWYWAGQSGQPSWLWGSNDGINMYVWNPNNFNVNTAQYLRSLGNQNCQIGRTQAYGDVYTYNTHNNTGSPTAYTSVIGFGRGIGGTVEIAGGWCDTNLYWRSLRDCCEDWYSWRTVLDSDNYTDFINNYYWANVKISTSANTQTQPSVNTIYASNWFRSQGTSGWYSESYGGGIWMNDSSWIRTYGGKSFYCDNQIYSSNSIRMSNILLEHTDEINNNANGGIHLNYRNSGNVSLCQGGGKVGIGTTTPAYKLDVKGQVKASGFIHSDHSINDAVLLAGGGYERIFMLGTTRYHNNTSYELSFHKLSGLCNNLVWVDGCIWNSTSISFQLSSDFYPYRYANSPSMRTIYRMDGNNMITVDGNGIVIISCSSYPRRVGFFYTGRA